MSGNKWGKIFTENQSVGGTIGGLVGAVAGFTGTAALLGMAQLGLPGIADSVAEHLDQAKDEGVRGVLEAAALAGAGVGARLGHAADPHVRRLFRHVVRK